LWFPIQVDGDYVGVVSHAEIVVEGRLYRVIA
jgi:hypothetical protein